MTKTMMRYLRYCTRKAFEAVDALDDERLWDMLEEVIGKEELDFLIESGYFSDEEYFECFEDLPLWRAVGMILGSYIQRTTSGTVIIIRKLKKLFRRDGSH